jgi:hypothetical protein
MVFKDTPALLLPIVLPLHFAAVVWISSRPQNRAQAGVVWRAFLAAMKGLPKVMASRRLVQQARKVSALAIARRMTWNPKDLTGRRPVVRPLRGPTRPAGA